VSGNVAAGRWVEVAQVVLAPDERASHLPDDTRAVPLELRVCGRLLAPGRVGDDVEIETRSGRRLRGRLADPHPRYRHGFGPPVPELTDAAEQARTILAERGEDAPP
jgi:hypothetical protein